MTLRVISPMTPRVSPITLPPAERPRLVLVHGWGFDPGLWTPLRAALAQTFPDSRVPDLVTLDLGFFGAPPFHDLSPPAPDRFGEAGAPVIAVGHSLGVLWLLLTQPFRWEGLVSINGFPRFIEGPDYAPAVPARPLARMIRRLDTDPQGVTLEFRARCGCFDPLPGPPDPGRLRQGLLWLRDGDARPGRTEAPPLLALAGSTDPILPVGMSEHCFSGFPKVEHRILAGGGHLLPLTAPAWCAAALAAFLARPDVNRSQSQGVENP